MNVPSDSWDTHLHVFDQSRFPYKVDRHYTPESVGLDDVLARFPNTNIMIVQASFEADHNGILAHLAEAKIKSPHRQFRAEIIWDPASNAREADIDHLHNLGVRCLRIHGQHGNGHGTDAEWAKSAMERTASVAERHGWAVAAQLPLQTWLAVLPQFSKCSTPIIVEHFGSPPLVPMTAEQWAQFLAFVDIVSANPRIFVKLSGLYRRVSLGVPSRQASCLVSALASRAPRALLFGSDYPHVDVETNSHHSTKNLKIDIAAELNAIKENMESRTWEMMMVDNPTRIFK